MMELFKKLKEQQVFKKFNSLDYWNRRATENTLHTIMTDPDRDKIEKSKVRDILNQFEYMDSVLDYGCGVGRFFSLLNVHFNNVWATDFSPEMLSKARLFSNNGIRFCDYKNPPKVDLVFCFTVLFHIVSKKEWLETMKKLRESTGKYLLICEKFKGGKLGITARHNKLRKVGEYLNAFRDYEWCKLYPNYVNGLDVLIIKKQIDGGIRKM